MRRLSRSVLSELPPSVRRPQYDRETLQIGIAHIGVGAFHRCHQAEFIDDMLEARFGRWGVLGVNLMAPSLPISWPRKTVSIPARCGEMSAPRPASLARSVR